MEQFYKDPRTPLRMREGPLGAYVDDLAWQLSEEGYARASARYALQLVADLGRWFARRKIVAEQLTPEHLERYLEYRSRHRHYRSGDAAIVRRLLKLLREKDIVAAAAPIERTPAQRLEEEFRQYLERERRLAPATVFHYLVFAKRFLALCFADGIVRLDSLRALDVVGFVQREAARLHHHPKRSKPMTTALRSFLQYARYRGLIRIDLRSSVPTVASWSMASLPKALSSDKSSVSWPTAIDTLRSAVAIGRFCCCSPGWGCVLVKSSAWRSRISTGKRGNSAFEHMGGTRIGYRFPKMSAPHWPSICVTRAPAAPRGGCSSVCELPSANSRVRWPSAPSSAAHSSAQGSTRLTKARTCCATPWLPRCCGKARH